LRTVFATLIFVLPVYAGLALALASDGPTVVPTSWLASFSYWSSILVWALIILVVNYLYAIGNRYDKLFAAGLTFFALLMLDSRAVITGPLRLYHLIDFKATLVATAAAEYNVRNAFGNCPSIEETTAHLAHKPPLTYDVQVSNSIGDNFVIKCGAKQMYVAVPKTSFAALRW
jgi:hypothetical protein